MFKMKPFAFDREAVKTQHGSDIAAATAEFFALYRGEMMDWIASMWDKKSGGFYYSVSARDNPQFFPDIESTGQAIGILQDTVLSPTLTAFPPKFCKRVCSFLEELQSPDGFFYHPQWGKNINESRRARDMGSASWVIEYLGGKLRYPTAVTQMKNRTESSTLPEHLRSRSDFTAYLDGLNINGSSYSAGQLIAMQAEQIAAAGLADVCIEYLDSKQKSNGLWEDELTQNSSNGLLKIAHAYKILGAPLPRMRQSILSVVEMALDSTVPYAVVGVFNPLLAIKYMRDIATECGDVGATDEALSIISKNSTALLRLTTEKLGAFRRPDFAFSYYPDRSSPVSQGVTVSLGLCEGDMNATQMAKAVGILAMEALGIDPGRHYSDSDSREYLASMCEGI